MSSIKIQGVCMENHGRKNFPPMGGSGSGGADQEAANRGRGGYDPPAAAIWDDFCVGRGFPDAPTALLDFVGRDVVGAKSAPLTPA